MNPKVDFFFSKDKWPEEIAKLREIVLACDLQEELKWGVPCYTLNGTNVVLIHVFKEYCALLFFKGALLNDPKKLLVQQTQNVQAARQLRFTGLNGIVKLSKTIRDYIFEAIEVEKAGLKVPYKKAQDFELPVEFTSQLEKSKALKKAFEGLTPGRQRAYSLYFSSAKQAKTREQRVEKYLKQILAGKGLDD